MFPTEGTDGGDHEDGFIDGGFDGFDEAGHYESEGFFDEVQGYDMDDDAEDPDEIISNSDSDSDSVADRA